MKITNTPEQLATLKNAVHNRGLGVRLFDCKSSDPKHNAQRNLDGLNNYVDDATLRFHKSRVLASRAICDGLFFQLLTSDAANMENSRRVFRWVVVDVFGETVYRPDLEDGAPDRKRADKAFEAEELDAVAHYREALARRARNLRDDLERVEKALALIG